MGKTTLISEYIKDKPSIFFYATEANINYQRQLFADLIIAYTGKTYLREIAFSSFEQLFIFLSENIKSRKIILAIDEYQQLAKLDRSFSSIVQKVWDNNLKTKNIHLILCGSAISMMYSEALSYSSPLYGRRTSSIFLKQNVSASYLTRYMRRLIDLDILKKEIPVTEKNPEKSKLGRYHIKDNFINFWFHYVFMNQSYLEIGNVDYVVDKIKSSFNEKFVSFAFEDYIMELILEDPVKYLGFTPIKIGRWWNNQEEIDFVAIGKEKAAFIECKWQNQKVGHKALLEGRIPRKWAKCILFDDSLKLPDKLFLSCYGFAEKPYQKEFSHVQRPEYKKRS